MNKTGPQTPRKVSKMESALQSNFKNKPVDRRQTVSGESGISVAASIESQKIRNSAHSANSDKNQAVYSDYASYSSNMSTDSTGKRVSIILFWKNWLFLKFFWRENKFFRPHIIILKPFFS